MQDPVPDLKDATRLELFRKRVFEKCEAKGVEQVRYEHVRAEDKTSDRAMLIREWIGIKTREEAEARARIERAAEREAINDAAAAESLRIAQASLRASQSASKAAWLAAILAIVAIAWTAFAYFFPRVEISPHDAAPSARSGAQVRARHDAKAPSTAPKGESSRAPR